MPDFARSSAPAVQAQLDRLTRLSPGRDTLGLERIAALLTRLGDPQHRLPPVFHVAGTNGKGSTCAFLRAMLEAAGHSVHVYTSPHLVRFNERIRLAGRLIADDALATYLARVLDTADGIDPSFFEVTTAAAFLAFAETPADACIVEVGLGGRLDATNVIARPLVCGIASLGIDHVEFLLAPEEGVPAEPLARIAFEKAGIAKGGAPLVALAQPHEAERAIAAVAQRIGAPLVVQGCQWTSRALGRGFVYRDRHGKLYGDPPALPGAHQRDNAALAIAMLRHQPLLAVSEAAIQRGLAAARWPARLQRLGDGPLTALAGEGAVVWLDGGHNVDAAVALAAALSASGPMHVVCGMLANKDAVGFLAHLAPHTMRFTAVPVPGHAHHDTAALAAAFADRHGIAAATAPDLRAALRAGAVTTGPAPILVCGSLYLAGEALRLNGELPS